MAQLSSVIGSILRDIISAQHEANLYSISLSECYGKDGKTKDFQLPNVMLSDMELELKYGVIGAAENKEEHNIKYSKFRQFIRDLCSDAAKSAIASVTSVILTTDIQREEDDKKFFYRLKQEEELNREFLQFLTRYLRAAFNQNLHESIDAESGKALPEKITDKMMDVIRKKFIDDNDLVSLFSGTDGKMLKSSVDEVVRASLLDLVTRAAGDTSFKRTKTFPKLDVAVTADELAKMPEDAIHSFKLKFTPTTCTLTTIEEAEDLDDFVMK